MWFAGAGTGWTNRDWRDVPGPLYTLGLYFLHRQLPATNFAHDDRFFSFVWRQPRDRRDIDRLKQVVAQSPYITANVGLDGDRHWSLDAIRAWWSGRETLARAYREAGLSDLGMYFERELPAYLRTYAFTLQEGRPPRRGEALPDIDAPPRIVIGPPRGTFDGALELYLRANDLVHARLRRDQLPLWGRARDRDPLDVPGVFTLAHGGGGASHAPANICAGFIYRQPRNPLELEHVLEHAKHAPLFGVGARARTSVHEIRAYWRQRHELRAALEANGVHGVEHYLAVELPAYLRGLLFVVEEGHLAEPWHVLPELDDITPERYWQTPRRDQLPFAAPEVDTRAFIKDVFAERHPLNVPGPFYGADSDTCGTGPLEAPANIACDAAHGQEFVYRQPRTARELAEVGRAAAVECFDGHACDGSAHWTPALVRAWWAARDAHRAAWRAAEIPDVDALFERELPRYLRAYVFFLVHGRPPTVADDLPTLETSC